MGLKAFFSLSKIKKKLTKAMLSTSTQYVNVRRFTVRRVATVSLSNRQRIVKKCKKMYYLLAKLSHSHHRELYVFSA